MWRVLKSLYSLASITRLSQHFPHLLCSAKLSHSSCWEESFSSWGENAQMVKTHTDSKAREYLVSGFLCCCSCWFIKTVDTAHFNGTKGFSEKYVFVYVLLTLNLSVLVPRGNSQTTLLGMLPEKFSAYLSTSLFLLPASIYFLTQNNSMLDFASSNNPGGFSRSLHKNQPYPL